MKLSSPEVTQKPEDGCKYISWVHPPDWFTVDKESIQFFLGAGANFPTFTTSTVNQGCGGLPNIYHPENRRMSPLKKGPFEQELTHLNQPLIFRGKLLVFGGVRYMLLSIQKPENAPLQKEKHRPKPPIFGFKMLLGGGNSNIFYFHPDPWGNDSQFDEHIFQMGWFNHQLYGCF